MHRATIRANTVTSQHRPKQLISSLARTDLHHPTSYQQHHQTRPPQPKHALQATAGWLFHRLEVHCPDSSCLTGTTTNNKQHGRPSKKPVLDQAAKLRHHEYDSAHHLQGRACSTEHQRAPLRDHQPPPFGVHRRHHRSLQNLACRSKSQRGHPAGLVPRANKHQSHHNHQGRLPQARRSHPRRTLRATWSSGKCTRPSPGSVARCRRIPSLSSEPTPSKPEERHPENPSRTQPASGRTCSSHSRRPLTFTSACT